MGARAVKGVFVAVALACVVPASAALAEIKVPAKVRYATQDGMSPSVATDVTFVTGSELNLATHSSVMNMLRLMQ